MRAADSNESSTLAPLERWELRERLLTRRGVGAEKDAIDMTVFERLPETLLVAQAELGVEAAQKELSRRKTARVLKHAG